MSEESETFDGIDRRELLRTALGSGLVGATGLGVGAGTVSAYPDHYERYWPIDSDVDSCTAVDDEVYPGTGPGAANWFFWNGCSSYKTYKAVPGEPLYLVCTTNAQILRDIAFNISIPDGSGGWEKVRTVNGPSGRHDETEVRYKPPEGVNRVRIDAFDRDNRPGYGFYLRVYGPPQGTIPLDVRNDIDRKDGLITSIRSFASPALPDDAPQLDQRARILLNRIQRDYPEADLTKQQQFDLALERMVEAERVTEVSVSEPKRFVNTVADKFLDMVLGTIGLAALSVGSVEGQLRGSTEAALAGDAIETELNALSMLQGIIASGLPTAEAERQAKNDFERLRNENEETLLEAGETALVEGVESGIDTITQEIKDQAESIAQKSEDLVAERIYEVYLFVEGLGTIGGFGDHPGIDPLLEREMRELEDAVSNNELQPDDKNRTSIREEKNTRTANLTTDATGKINGTLIEEPKDAIVWANYPLFMGGLILAIKSGGLLTPVSTILELINIGASQAYAQLSISQVAYGGWTLNELQGVHENGVTEINDP